MKQTLTFISSIANSKQSSIQGDAYEKSLNLYNEKQYVQAFHSLLDYLNSSFRAKYGNADGTEFHIPHGSILVHIYIKDDFLYINADFLNLPENGRVAMLRQVADLNLNKLILPRFVKEGNRLKMEYTCSLSQSHPHKMYFVLQNICHIGDKYDDEFCTKFGATRCYEPLITPYPEEEIDRIYEGIQTLGQATLEAIKEYCAERKYGYAWNVLDTTFYQISYFACPQGQLCNDLDKVVVDMDAQLPVSELVAKGRIFLEKLLATPKEQLATDLYFVDTLVSTKRRSYLKNIQENYANVYKEATEAIQCGNYEQSAVRLLYIFYETYFYNDVQEDVDTLILHALQKAGGQPFEVASAVLFDAMEKIMEGDWELEFSESMRQKKEQLTKTQIAMQTAMTSGDIDEFLRLAQDVQEEMMRQAFDGQE